MLPYMAYMDPMGTIKQRNRVIVQRLKMHSQPAAQLPGIHSQDAWEEWEEPNELQRGKVGTSRI